MTIDSFTIKLAGVNVGVCASFFSSQEYCKDYLTNDAADVEVVVSKDDVAVEAGASKVKYSDEYYETLAICRKVAEALIAKGVLLVHGSAIEAGGKCYIFTGPSGIGKSTHASLWKKLLGDDATIINDDKPFVKISSKGCKVFGSPWSGEQNINTNTSAPLKAICFIEQNKTNEIRQIENRDAIELLMPQIYKPSDAFNVNKTLELTDMLMKNTDFYQLKCNTDISAAEISYKALMA